jgi:hypothetical protein
VLEVHYGGDRKKDAEHNVSRYARLGIPEYFLYDRERNRLAAYRLISPEMKVYTPIIPNQGMDESRVLGLSVQVDVDRLRFYAGTELLLESDELITRLQDMCDQATRRAEPLAWNAERLPGAPLRRGRGGGAAGGDRGRGSRRDSQGPAGNAVSARTSATRTGLAVSQHGPRADRPYPRLARGMLMLSSSVRRHIDPDGVARSAP